MHWLSGRMYHTQTHQNQENNIKIFKYLKYFMWHYISLLQAVQSPRCVWNDKRVGSRHLSPFLISFKVQVAPALAAATDPILVEVFFKDLSTDDWKVKIHHFWAKLAAKQSVSTKSTMNDVWIKPKLPSPDDCTMRCRRRAQQLLLSFTTGIRISFHLSATHSWQLSPSSWSH